MQILFHRFGPDAQFGPIHSAEGLKGWIGKCIIQIFADDGGFTHNLTVMNQGGHHMLGVELEVGRVELLAFQDIHVMALPRKPLFLQA